MTPAQITSISAKVDGSVRLGINTPELTAEEKVEIMKLQNANIDAYFIPKDEPVAEKIKVKGDINTKTPSQRMRAVIFLLWKQAGEPDTFESYYAMRTEKIIDLLKEQIE